MNYTPINVKEDIDYFPKNHPMNADHRSFTIDLSEGVNVDVIQKLRQSFEPPVCTQRKQSEGDALLPENSKE